jgi:hypothetical protein
VELGAESSPEQPASEGVDRGERRRTGPGRFDRFAALSTVTSTITSSHPRSRPSAAVPGAQRLARPVIDRSDHPLGVAPSAFHFATASSDH